MAVVLHLLTFTSILLMYVSSARPPHIVLIVADDLGWNDVGWRNPQMYTPNLDKLATAGVILNSSYVQPLCTPTRNCLMTGYYPYHTGLQHSVIVPDAAGFLPANFTTLPQKLKELGYVTHIVGKWHLGFCNWKYTPTYRGFDSFMGYYNAAEDYYTHYVGPGYDFRFNTDVYRPTEGEYSANIFANRAIDILNSVDPENESLFLYLPFQTVHEPLEVPEKYENIYSHIHNTSRRLYCGMVSALDEAVGNITAVLRERGFMDNLLLVFTTDNGGPTFAGANNLPLRGAKSTLWEGGTKGSAFVYSDTLLKKTKYLNTEMMHAVDWFPTLLHVAGGTADAGMDGMDMWPTISNNAPSPRKEFVYNIDEILHNAAIRVGDYKLIEGNPGHWNGWYPLPSVKEGLPNATADGAAESKNCMVNISADPNYQLFDIRNDPTEHFDISKKYPKVLQQMTQRLAEYKKSLVPANYPPPDPKSNPKYYNGTWSPGWC
ncbi:hypothetical protein CHS0354_036641 [Potamilus streckersoni]|uniref:Sulfatase N-terminal domain-containing protein n=1 Tax=Potamilus streckersoni TaxID=2493646 RepID=A0AAE0SRM6_9BIVA|nr:hypothetical protein CHS0354_036641 [Potamilus streckersoni]